MRAAAVPDRSGAARRRVPAGAAQTALALGCILLTGLAPDLAGSGYWSYSFQYVNVLIAVAVAQNVLFDDARQVSFGQGAMFGVGAYAAAMAMSLHGLPWIVAACVATLASGVAGLLYAIPALRVQGYYLGFVTLSAAAVFPEVLFLLDRYTNGINGVSTPAGDWKIPLFLGVTPLSLATTALAALAVLAHVALRRSAAGRRVMIAGQSPESAQTLGIRPGVMRCAVFCAVSAFAGAAGALYPPIVGFVSPAAFHLELSILLFLAVVVGGRGQILGPVAGIYLLHLLPNVLLVELVDYRLLVYGAVALLVMLWLPDGVVGSLARLFRREADGGSLTVSADRLPLPAPAPGIEDRARLSVRAARKSFGAVAAIDGVDLDVASGRIVGLVGANGSGKTSLINAITGFSRLDSGSIEIGGASIAGLSPAGVARLGVGRTFQTPRIFDSMSVWENIAVGAESAPRRLPPPDLEALAELRRALEGVGAERVPHGQRRSIEAFRVILTGAEIVLLDEPAAGLSRRERADLETLLRRLRDEARRAVILVEHDLELVWRVADEVVVLEAGRVVARGAPDAVRRDPAVAKLFVHVAAGDRPTPPPVRPRS